MNHDKRAPVAVLFVCLANICRSPAAEGILRHLTTESMQSHVEIGSRGIGSWSIGQLADSRMRQLAGGRGFYLTSRAQQIQSEDFQKYDYILAADSEILHDLLQMAKQLKHKAKIHLMSEFSQRYHRQEIPDPYYGSEGDFEEVLDMLEDCCQGVLKQLAIQHNADD